MKVLKILPGRTARIIQNTNLSSMLNNLLRPVREHFIILIRPGKLETKKVNNITAIQAGSVFVNCKCIKVADHSWCR